MAAEIEHVFSLTRRSAIGASAATLAAFATACATANGAGADEQGRLAARPSSKVQSAGRRRGIFLVGGVQRAWAYAPSELEPATPAPFMLLLHGGGGDAEGLLRHVLPTLRDDGVILMAPRARGWTWDVIDAFRKRDRGVATPFGSDTARIDGSLAEIFANFAIDPARCAIAGFSDGASYALSLGARNTGLFSHIIAFSPGGVVPFAQGGRAPIFISHGRKDDVLPLANVEDGIVPGFRSAGFDVTLHRFDGFHELRGEEVRTATDWFLAPA